MGGQAQNSLLYRGERCDNSTNFDVLNLSNINDACLSVRTRGKVVVVILDEAMDR
jgi:hypothetical protein